MILVAGFCVAYLVFIAQNLAPMTGYRGVYFILGCCPVVVALAMLRGVRALAPFSLIADAANVLGRLFTPKAIQAVLCAQSKKIQ